MKTFLAQFRNTSKNNKETAAVSCSPFPYVLGGVGLGGWLTGQLGRAWVVHGVGAWHVHEWCMVGGDVVMTW